ncbi:sugar dehydrogenase complex small subunit [Shewanella sp.]|uniref:sugar dehydrogenase complex small subunit n=1 Tax=Shewanella sp. TaxID=50422 RepID=UPI003A982AF1
MNKKTDTKSAVILNRRHFLASGMVLAGAAMLKPAIAWADAASLTKEQQSFSQLAHFITGKPQLDEVVIQRAFDCLMAGDKDFLTKAHNAASAIKQAGLTSADDLNGHALLDNPEMAVTLQQINSAFYLGYTGTPISGRAKDNTKFVTYTDALMYPPTADATVIPSYSRGHTNYWVNPPASLKK